MPYHHYLLEPRSPLSFGTGRPSGFGLGGDSYKFPFPGTVAGCLRDALSEADGHLGNPYERFSPVDLSIRQLAMARFDYLAEEPLETLLLPRPEDAVYLGGSVVPLRPRLSDRLDKVWSDLPEVVQPLVLDGPEEILKRKPDDAPDWWSVRTYSSWLARAVCLPQAELPDEPTEESKAEERTHVAIKPGSRVGEHGGLTRRGGRDHGPRLAEGKTHGLGLLVALGPGPGANGNLHSVARRLGGGGGFVRFRTCVNSPDALEPRQPPGLEEATLVRFILSTPAVFPLNGWLPDGWAQGAAALGGHVTTDDGERVAVRLRAAAVLKHQSYAAWQPRSEAKSPSGEPGRPWRVVPAGTVYWLEVERGQAGKLWGASLCADSDDGGLWRSHGWGRGYVGLCADHTTKGQ